MRRRDKHRLCDVLVGMGYSRSTIEEAARSFYDKEFGPRFGEYLVEISVITRDHLRIALLRQNLRKNGPTPAVRKGINSIKECQRRASKTAHEEMHSVLDMCLGKVPT